MFWTNQIASHLEESGLQGSLNLIKTKLSERKYNKSACRVKSVYANAFNIADA